MNNKAYVYLWVNEHYDMCILDILDNDNDVLDTLCEGFEGRPITASLPEIKLCINWVGGSWSQPKDRWINWEDFKTKYGITEYNIPWYIFGL